MDQLLGWVGQEKGGRVVSVRFGPFRFSLPINQNATELQNFQKIKTEPNRLKTKTDRIKQKIVRFGQSVRFFG